MVKSKDKLIEWLSVIEVPYESKASFCGSDDDDVGNETDSGK